jgi:hypothetical protein
LHVKAAGGHYQWKNIVMPRIREYFPDAYMTSGSFVCDKMNVTIALEK